ncbi:MAG: glycoside hydrolase family 127 protein, partial [Planctomycetales bacterium]|nr:glycoside hydrolase family 127 protein [Planctomycetales bacterium]
MLQTTPFHRRAAIRTVTTFMGATAFLTATTFLASMAAVRAAELFDLSDVELLEGPFLHATKLNRDQLLSYDADRLLAPFLAEAGLEPKAKRYGNWESIGLDGHTAGHYLSALANAAATLDDDACRERIAYMVSEMARCQEAHGDGYVGGVPRSRELWSQIESGNVDASGFSLGNRWVPLYNLHKTFAGLRDAYVVAGNAQAKDVLVKLADWALHLVQNLSDDQLQGILATEHGGINETFADVAAITGDEKYVALAQRFCHRAIFDPLAAGEDKLNGLHANTQVPKVIGFQRIAALGGGEAYHRAAEFFWNAVVASRTIAFGGNSISEHFPAPHQSMRWIEHREGPETCNTYNMLRLTEQLFEANPTAKLADFYERALFNHILSTQHPEHGGYVYFTSARPRHYRVYSKAGEAFWCCVGSGMENHGKYGRFIYAHADDALYVNLFVASRLKWQSRGLRLIQKTRFPDESDSRLKFELERPTEFTLKIRHPAWVEPGELRVSVNGEAVSAESQPSSYIDVRREWKDGDEVSISTPMHPHAEPLPFLDDYVALLYGPIVLAAKSSTDDLVGLVAGSGRMDHVAGGPLKSLDEAPMLVADSNELTKLLRPVPGESLTFTLAGAIRPDTYDQLKLEPFFRLHDARYVLYWRTTTPEGYERVLAEMEAAEREQMALDRATVDRVAPGEQQPETEHNFQDDDSSAGIWQDRRFRHANGWFSYDLRAGDQKDLKLRATYFGSDRRDFNILVNGSVLAEVRLQAPRPGEFFDVDYPIAPEMLEKAEGGVLRVRFV